MGGRGWTIPEVYATRGCDLDTCPECGGPKTKHGAMCIACRRRIGRARRPIGERFWEKVDQRGTDECWPWTGAVDPNGYGRFNAPGHSSKSSRLVIELETGAPITDGLSVLHRCDNPPCCNPAHLFLGTQRDNIHDAMAKGRMPKPPNRWRNVA